MRQDTLELEEGYTWWVALFFDGSSTANVAARVVRGAFPAAVATTVRTNGQCPSNEKRCEAGGMKDEQVSKVESNPTSNRRRQLLPNNAPL